MTPTSETLTALTELAGRVRQERPAFPAERFSGCGIVVAAGGVTTFISAYVLVYVLRRVLGSRLPIEVWHLGAGEMSPTMAALLVELEVRVVDALPKIAAAGANIRDGWQLKCFALMHSAFREVLMLDADQVPLRDPAELFGWPVYRDTGAVFWPDIVDLRRDNQVWGALGLEPRRTRSMESGQILVDKARNWPALAATLALNEQAERLYSLIYGDKDTFLLGWELTGSAFHLIPHQPYREERLLAQRDPDGAPLFQHRTNGKWRYAGQQGAIETFRYEAECLAALAVLRARWNGRIFYPPDRSASARAAESRLANRRYRLEQVGDSPLEVELLAYGEIGAGRSAARQNWWCEEVADEVALIFSDGAAASYRFTSLGPHWSGGNLFDAGAPVHLVAVDAIAETTGPGLADELLRAADPLGGTAADRARLVAAAELLARVDPSLAARFEQLLATDLEMLRALPAMAQVLRPGALAREVERPGSWTEGYQPVAEPDA